MTIAGRQEAQSSLQRLLEDLAQRVEDYREAYEHDLGDDESDGLQDIAEVIEDVRQQIDCLEESGD